MENSFSDGNGPTSKTFKFAYKMNPYSYSLILVGIMALVVGLGVRGQDSKSLARFSTVCLLMAAWQLSWSLLLNLDDQSSATLVAKVGHVPIILLLPATVSFYRTFLNCEDLRKLNRGLYLLAIPLLLLLPTDLLNSFIAQP